MGEVIKLKVATSEEVINLKSASGSLAVEAVSPRVNLEKVDGGTRLNITDVEGTKSTIIPDGEKGDPGESYIFDEHPTDNSPNPVRSRGLKSEFDSVRSDIQHCYDSVVEAVLNSEIRLNMKFGQKQDVLTFDEYPTVNSDNPVKSNGIKILIDAIVSTIPRHASDLIDDSGHYTKPPQGIPASDLAYGVIPDISQKQDLLSFDQTPTLNSTNPVTSNGVKRAIDTAYNQVSGETDLKLLAKANRADDFTEGNLAALDEYGNPTDSGAKVSDFLTQHQNITGKADKVSNATSGDFAALDANGNLTDSGAKANDFVTRAEYTVDDEISSTSANPVQNRVIKAAIDGAMRIEQVNTPVFREGYYIYYAAGTSHPSETYNHTDYIDIEGASFIRYMRIGINNNTSPAGIAFYDSNKTYIDGIQSELNTDRGYVGLYDAPVPSGAMYARFTMFANTQTYGVFALYVSKTELAIGKKQDALTFDSVPTSNSVNPVTSGGVYTALQAKADPVTVETVSGTDPVIVGTDNHRYICGTVDTLTLTTPASGIVDVVFTSGTTPTVLSVTPPTGMTMRWPDWFNPSALEASATYEINIMDGTLGAVGIWT